MDSQGPLRSPFSFKIFFGVGVDLMIETFNVGIAPTFEECNHYCVFQIYTNGEINPNRLELIFVPIAIVAGVRLICSTGSGA
jgi:hypothetical protein